MPGARGKFHWKPRPARPGEINYALLDRFTFAHFGIGIGYGLLGFTFNVSIGLAFAWELLENPLKANLPFLFPHATADTFRNIVGDILALTVGWAVVQYLK